MATTLFNRYIWIIDTIRRYGRIRREKLNSMWLRSQFSDGQPIPRRTFYNYRTAISELFGINIECDPTTYEYYITNNGSVSDSVTDWMLNSAAVGNIIGEASEIAGKIFVEDVPSARQYLSSVIDALKENRQVKFSYQPYTRTTPTRNIALEPYFLKIFRQRWYLTGRNIADDQIKTYALDRMTELTLENETFTVPESFDAEAYCNDSFGIVFNQGEVKDVTLKVGARQAKYFRALPLHHSQQEFVHDNHSIFKYRLRLTGDFVEELLKYGSNITVLSPPELRAMITTELKGALENYSMPSEE